MKFFLIPAVAFIFACNSPNLYTKAQDAQDAGRQFIEASLDGDYKKAAFYLLKDTVNMMLLERQESNYQHMNHEKKREYREADIRPIAIKNETDSLVSYKYYHTSNPTDTTTLRIVKINGEWLVDLKSILKQ